VDAVQLAAELNREVLPRGVQDRASGGDPQLPGPAPAEKIATSAFACTSATAATSAFTRSSITT
jgi:hypothetical protein